MVCEFVEYGWCCYLFVVLDCLIYLDGWVLQVFVLVNWLFDFSVLDWIGIEFLGMVEFSWGNWYEKVDLIGLFLGMDVVVNVYLGVLYKVVDYLCCFGVMMIDYEYLLEWLIYGCNYGLFKLVLVYEYVYDLILICFEVLCCWMYSYGMLCEKLMVVVNVLGYLLLYGVCECIVVCFLCEFGQLLCVLFMGRLDLQKGVYWLFVIFYSFVFFVLQIELIIVGGFVVDLYQVDFIFLCGIWMFGFVCGVEVLMDLFLNIDIMLLLLYYEGLLFFVFEVQCCGVVVIVIDVGVMDEVIQNGIIGFILFEVGCEVVFVIQIFVFEVDCVLLVQVLCDVDWMVWDWFLVIQFLLVWLNRRESGVNVVLDEGVEDLDMYRSMK